jgi:hypothetical protein
LDEHRLKFDREVLLHGKNISEEEFQKLLAQHNEERESLKMNFDKEHDRQRKAITDRVSLSLNGNC